MARAQLADNRGPLIPAQLAGPLTAGVRSWPLAVVRDPVRVRVRSWPLAVARGARAAGMGPSPGGHLCGISRK